MSKRREMSYEERRAYRRRKRLIRRIQVYSELALIVIVIGLVAVLVVSKLGKKDTGMTVAAEESEANAAVEEDTGLKVSAMAGEDPDAASEESETTVTEESEVAASTGTYSAVDTGDTVSIGGDVVSEYGILINNDTKQIVASKNATERIVPASMTKVMTVLVAAKNISADQLDEVVTMSHEAVDYSYAGGGSTSGFVEDEEVTVRDLFYGTILPSGGDAAAQLAMYVAGDIDSFVDMMNKEADSLGLTGTHFTNPVGFYNEDHYSTPYDIAIIMMAALDDDICNEVLNTKVYQSTATNVNPEGITISNWFLRRIEDKDIGGTIGGAKTGYVDESGSCAVSSMTSDSGTNYICCTAKSSSSWQCIYDHVAIYKNYTK
ncbi:D-alanyl-D-alanine carboxypeptidase family protein [Pseudobutyrivibrio sp.]|uniref:D-alanyl-D-alanine carboxypeptidase family protein n=1 Tax=Pseudobutyrivibrio sp. TaxID=2014367 RepID=UPI001DCBC68A|nr:serine hydrolase [Pseudobutyrivibrio sp.]MBE5911644.1 D-alanyl-D-alanine carboxypeptidase [Pseudobutyrivibrio sp.]